MMFGEKVRWLFFSFGLGSGELLCLNVFVLRSNCDFGEFSTADDSVLFDSKLEFKLFMAGITEFGFTQAPTSAYISCDDDVDDHFGPPNHGVSPSFDVSKSSVGNSLINDENSLAPPTTVATSVRISMSSISCIESEMYKSRMGHDDVSC